MNDDDFRELKEEIRYIRDVMVRLETTMGAIPEKLTDHELRIRQLEKDKWPMPKVTVGIAMLGLLAAIFIPFLI